MQHIDFETGLTVAKCQDEYVAYTKFIHFQSFFLDIKKRHMTPIGPYFKKLT